MNNLGKILLVDDDKMNGKFLSKRLNKKGYECDFVLNHTECFEALEVNNYDVVLLDIMMPDVSGIEVLEKIRESKNRFELPVIMVSSKEESVDIVDALSLGASDYITKPVNIEIAMARISTQIKIKELSAESLMAKQMSTISTLVTTLNHEINNPLAIAMGNLKISVERLTPERISKALSALDRIAQIVKKIEKINNGSMEESEYSSTSKMFKI